MTSKAEWRSVPRSACEGEAALFFKPEEWATIEAAAARIYPADGGLGPREAGVVRFIDRYLSGVDFIFASADGEGFLEIGAKDAGAWRMRIERLQALYRDGVQTLNATAQSEFGSHFNVLGESEQDRVLEIVSGAPKPTGVSSGESGEAHVQNISDDSLPFFVALALHTRQGMFCDPVYGGNRDGIGWRLIGFPGPTTLATTRDCTYAHPDKFLRDFDWADLIPHMRASDRRGQTPN